jgi:hypothetical protein
VRPKPATDAETSRAPGETRPAPESRQTQALLAEITGLRAELQRVDRETEALRRTAARAQQALREAQGGAAVSQAPPGPQPPLRRASAASPATDEVRQLQQDLAGAQASLAALSADLEAAKGAPTGTGRATDAAAGLAALKQQLSSAHRRAAQLGITLASEPADEVEPAEPAPLPSPPAPR